MNVPATVDAMRFTVSGIGDLWSTTPDEAVVLQQYQSIRDAGRGSMYVEFADSRAVKFDIKSCGSVQVLNALLPAREKRFKD